MGVVAIDFDRYFLAELLPSGGAVVALAGAVIVMHRHALADARFRGPDRGADRDHHAARFMPGDDRAFRHGNAGGARLALGPAVLMQVAAAHAGGLHLDDDIMGIGGGIFEPHQFQPTFAREYNAAHGLLRFVIVGGANFDRKKRGWQRVGRMIFFTPSLRANGSRECAPDDRLREAIQLWRRATESWIASSQVLLAMTARYGLPISRRNASELCMKLPPPEGVGNAGRRCTRSRACSVVNTRVSHHRSTGTSRHSRTQWFYGLFRALPGDRACLPPSSAELLPPT